MEAAGAASSARLVDQAASTTVCTQTATAAAPSSGTMTITGASTTNTATGTLTAVELQDRSSTVLRTYTVGAIGSGRDIILTISSGSGASVSGNDIVISGTGVTFGTALIVETAS